MTTPFRAAQRRIILPAGIALTLALSVMAAGLTSAGGVTTVDLGLAEPFAVLAGEEVTSTGNTTVTGNLGVYAGSSVTGFPPGIVNGTQHVADTEAQQAQAALVTAYTDAATRPGSTAITGGDLAGQVLVAGVYNSDGAILDLTGALVLDGQNDPNSVWIFQASSSLVTATGSTVAFVRGGSPCNVFWQVTSSATLGSGSTLEGNILALQSITMGDDATVNGRALARNATVTMINDTIDNSMCVTAGPTPTATPPPASPSPVPPGAPTPTPLLPNTSFEHVDGAGAPPPILVVVVATAAILFGTFAILRHAPARKDREE